jgi:uncharacterized protein YqeY
MLRAQFNDSLKTAMKAHDAPAVSTLRMILATLKDRDIAARGKGNAEGLGDPEIQQMLQGMIKQRRESAALYEQGARPELAAKELAEVVLIEGFLPRQLDDAAVQQAVAAAIAEAGAASAKDMGRVMALLRERHAGQMDFSKASGVAKKLLG